ncbi:MAG TPA: hypothetical protein VGM18_05075 [Candidatus Sulfotelmatobacter sp.]
MKAYAKRAGVCERTMRSHMRQLERLFGTCEVHVDGPDPYCEQCRSVALFQLDRRHNTIRRPSTHKLNTDRLVRPRRDDGLCPACGHSHQGSNVCGCELQSRHSYKRRCRCEAQYETNVTPIRKPSQAASSDPQPPAAAAPPEADAAHDQSQRRITRDERFALFSAYIALKKSGMAHDAAIGEVHRQFKGRYSGDDIDFAVKIAGPKQEHRQERAREQMQATDAQAWQRLSRAIINAREASVGSGLSGEDIFARACRFAGISVERGNELWERNAEEGS